MNKNLSTPTQIFRYPLIRYISHCRSLFLFTPFYGTIQYDTFSSLFKVFMAKLLSMVPSHWTLLYDSRQDGSGTNRFLHHVLGYRGPNLILFRCDDDLLFCVANPSEWRETHLYIGDEDSCCLQLLPKYVSFHSAFI